MTVRVNKQAFNIREKLSELERPIGVKGNELMRAETAQDARDLVSAGRKNIIINGAMEVAQRSTSVTGETSAGAYLTVDRFANHGSGGTYNSSQETVTNGGMTGLPIKFKKYFKFSATTGANNCGIWQTIEDVRTVQGEHTFSFYARGINPGGGSLEIDSRQYFNGSTEVDSIIGNFSVTDTWQRFTFTFTLASLSGKTIGSDNYNRFFIRQPNADNSTNAWHIDTTGWQIESGRNATEFEHRSYAEELALCKRYYQRWNGNDPDFNAYDSGANRQGATSVARATMIAHGHVHDPDDANVSMMLDVEMRDNPTVELPSGNNSIRLMVGPAIYDNASLVQENNCSRNILSIFVDNGGTMTASQPSFIDIKRC